MDRSSTTRRGVPNANMIYLPVHASWLNHVEIYFSVIQRKPLTPNELTGPTTSVSGGYQTTPVQDLTDATSAPREGRSAVPLVSGSRYVHTRLTNAKVPSIKPIVQPP
jgi:hypothetical protein